MTEEPERSLGTIIETVRRIEGLHVGLLNDDEREAFNTAERLGLASRRYEGPAGFLGLPKVRLAETIRTPAQ